jgi:hypothetical protein
MVSLMDKSDRKIQAASEAGRALSRLGAAKGGRARADALAPSVRSEQAKHAAEARWGTNLPKATHEGPLVIGSVELPCYVLSDGRRVIVRGALQTGIGMSSGGGKAGLHRIGAFLQQIAEKGIDITDLASRADSPIQFVLPRGGFGLGYEATILADICEVVLEARRRQVLRSYAEPIAMQCEVLMRAFAKVGIIALVDEATGYQADRARDELNAILQAYIAEELRPWVQVFPDEFFRQIYRLQGWQYKPGVTQGPRYIGKLINEYIYKRLPPGVLDELQKRNPSVRGRRKTQHHRLLTDHTGVPHLDKQIVAVTTLLKVSPDKKFFSEMLARAFPKKGEQMPLALPVDDEESE